MKKQWYGVKLLYRYKIKDQPGGPVCRTLFEESVVLVKAKSFDHAYEKVEKRARKVHEVYENQFGQQVTRTFDQSIDCFWLFDQPASHTEVYSSHFALPEGQRIKETLERRYSFCSREEMELLRRE